MRSRVDIALKLIWRVTFSPDLGREFGAIRTDLPAAFQQFFREAVGRTSSLLLLRGCMEGFLKSVLFLSGLKSKAEVTSSQFKMIQTLKALRFNAQLGLPSRAVPNLNDDLVNFDGHPEYLRNIASAYQSRNEIHISPDLGLSEVLLKGTDFVIVMLYACLSHEEKLERLPEVPWETMQVGSGSRQTEKEKYLYDFMSLGETPNNIRNKLIDCYIVGKLFGEDGLTSDSLRSSTNTQFELQLSKRDFDSIVNRLARENRLTLDRQTGLLNLTSPERTRLASVRADYQTNKELFDLYLDDLLKSWSLEASKSKFLELLEDHYVQSFLQDEMESYGQGQMVGDEGSKGVVELTQFAETLITDPLDRKRFLTELAGLVRQSDFVARIAFGKSFAAMTNPERFGTYLREAARYVYLDSQVLLYLLCQGYTDEDFDYGNPYFSAAAQLLALAHREPSIQFFTSRRYLEEVTYHAKLALLLIPLAEHIDAHISSNVFFDFYWHLKKENRLAAGDQVFADFLRNWLDMFEADALKSDFIVKGSRAIKQRLENDYQIKVVDVDQSSNWQDAAESLRESLSKRNQRPDLAIRADALMMLYLCDTTIHPVEPFFLTWDGAFPRFRANYLEQIHSHSVTFHLFNPAKFVNHMSLLRFRVNPQALTQDFLIMMEGIDIAKDFVTLWDRINQILQVDGMNLRLRRQLVDQVQQLLSKEFGITENKNVDESRAGKAATGLDAVVAAINDHFGKSSGGLDQYRRMFMDEDVAKQLISLIFSSAKDPSRVTQMITEIDRMIATKREGKGE